MKHVKLFEEFVTEYNRVAYNIKISGKYELSIDSKKYNISVAGFERQGDDTDGLYLMDSDPQKDMIGSIIVKNKDMVKMSKGTSVNIVTSKNNIKGTLKKLK
jgi:hypothetical protein